MTIVFVSCTTDDGTPQITEHEFPFHIEYSVGDSVFVIEDTIVCSFDGFTRKGGWHGPLREWRQKLKSTNDYSSDVLIIKEYKNKSIFRNRENNCSFVYLCLGQAEYYMGEPKYEKTSAPCFYYHESFTNPANGNLSAERTVLTESQLKEHFNIEILQFSFSSPIENTFE